MPQRISSISREYIMAAVSTTAAGDAVDPTADTVVMAFVPYGSTPTDDDWQTASWQTYGGTYYARCLVGPGGTVALAAGEYRVWVKFTDTPEVPAHPAGTVTVF